MDRALASKIADDAFDALSEVASKYGLTLDRKSGSYDSFQFSIKFQFAEEGADRDEFIRYASVVGLTPEHFGQQFKSNGKHFEVSGINLRAKKYPVQAKCLTDGKSYKFTADSVKRLVVLT